MHKNHFQPENKFRINAVQNSITSKEIKHWGQRMGKANSNSPDTTLTQNVVGSITTCNYF